MYHCHLNKFGEVINVLSKPQQMVEVQGKMGCDAKTFVMGYNEKMSKDTLCGILDSEASLLSWLE